MNIINPGSGFIGSRTTAELSVLSPTVGSWAFNSDRRGRIERYNGNYWIPETYGNKEFPAQWWSNHDFTSNPTGPDGWSMATTGTPAIDVAEISGNSIRLKRTIGPSSSTVIKKTFDISPRGTLNIGNIKVSYKMSSLQSAGTASNNSTIFAVGIETGLNDIIECQYEVTSGGAENIYMYRDIGNEGAVTDDGGGENWISSTVAVDSVSQLAVSDDDVLCFLYGEIGEGMNGEAESVTSRRFVEGTSEIDLYIRMDPDPLVTSSDRWFDITISDIFVDID